MKPTPNKLRGGGNSALTALKARCQREFETENVSATLDQIMAWAADEKNTNAGIRNLIGEHYLIQLSRDSQLSSFYSWVKLTRKTAEREGKIQHWLECEKLEHPELSEAELERRGQRKFKLLAIAEEDPDAWAKILKADREKEQLTLDREKFATMFCEKFLIWFKDAKARQIAESSTSNADKIAELRREYFKDVDALQASGQVKLPE